MYGWLKVETAKVIRDANSVTEDGNEKGIVLFSRLGGLGNVVTSRGGVWGTAQVGIKIYCSFNLQVWLPVRVGLPFESEKRYGITH